MSDEESSSPDNKPEPGNNNDNNNNSNDQGNPTNDQGNPTNAEEVNPKVLQLQQMLANKRTKKRLYKGAKMDEIFKYKITPIKEKETVFALQEYIREVIKTDPTNVEACIALPADIQESTIVYLLEVMKYFLIEVGFFVVFLSADCNKRNCRKMQATAKFMYRCSAHKRPKDCSAIQYCIHTLDLFTEKLNAKEYRVSFKIPAKRANKDMSDLCRRVYRIFAHAFFHHRQLFDNYEAENLLCTRFLAFFKKYHLVPRELFMREIQIPPNSLYSNPSNRKKKIAHFFAEQKRKLEERENLTVNTNNAGHLQQLSSENFMRNVEIVELDSNEVY